MTITKYHGMSRNAHYKRWKSCVQRCYNPKANGYRNYGGAGIGVDWVWHPSNVDGPKNFIEWFEKKLHEARLIDPNLNAKVLEVGRKDVKKNFGPDNCELMTSAKTAQTRGNTILTFEKVVTIRQYKKTHRSATLSQMDLIFQAGINNLSRCLRGTTWANVNEVEAPVLV